MKNTLLRLFAGAMMMWPVLAGSATAQETAPVDALEISAANAIRDETGQILGPETRLPLPRFVSLKTAEANIRRGPSLSHRIDWIFQRRNMPVQVVAEYGHWRRIIDRDGLGGWVHYSLISGVRTVIVTDDLTPVYPRVGSVSTEVARLEAGVVARLFECDPQWCKVGVEGYKGWVAKSAIWGVTPDEAFD